MTDKDALIEEMRAQIDVLTLRNAGLRAQLSLAQDGIQIDGPTNVDRIVTALRVLHEHGHSIGRAVVDACRRHSGSPRPDPEHVTDEGLAERLEALVAAVEQCGDLPQVVKAGDCCYVVRR